MTYYDTSYPPSLWEETPTPSTGATAGIPGSWTPVGSTPPATLAALQGGSVVASPATAWLLGQYVQTGTAGAPGEATWTGSGWVGGRSPGLAAQTARKAPGRASQPTQPDEGSDTAPDGEEAPEGAE